MQSSVLPLLLLLPQVKQIFLEKQMSKFYLCCCYCFVHFYMAQHLKGSTRHNLKCINVFEIPRILHHDRLNIMNVAGRLILLDELLLYNYAMQTLTLGSSSNVHRLCCHTMCRSETWFKLIWG